MGRRKKYDISFLEAYTGFRNSKEKFFDKILSESQNNANIITLEEIIKKSSIIFNNQAIEVPVFSNINLYLLPTIENFSLIKTPLIGKEDS